jgi:glycosyltransferase involved in cell wall biosynthesis
MSATTPDNIAVVAQPGRREGGAGETQTQSFCSILSAFATVSVIAPNVADDATIREEYNAIEVSDQSMGDSIAVAAWRFLLNQLRMCQILLAHDAEAVVFYGTTSYVFPILTARLAGKTVFVEPKGDVPLALYLQWRESIPDPVARTLSGAVGLLEQTGYLCAHTVVTYTPSMADQLGLDPESSGVYPDGARYADTDRFSVETPMAHRDRTVGFVGRLDTEKNVLALAEAATQLPDDVTFVFVGDGDDRDRLESQYTEAFVSGDIECTGWVDNDEVPAHLNEFEALVLASDPTEGLPTVILEAFACGTPVVSTPVAGVTDVVHDGQTGLTVDAVDPGAIANGIESILGADKNQMSWNCRALVDEHYDYASAVERYRALFEPAAGDHESTLGAPDVLADTADVEKQIEALGYM